MYTIRTTLLEDRGAQDYSVEGRSGKYRFITVRADGRIAKMRADVNLATSPDMLDSACDIQFDLIVKNERVEAIARGISRV